MPEAKIGLLSVYFGLFDDAMPAGFRQSRERFADEVRRRLADHGEVVALPLVDGPERAAEAGAVLAAASVDVVVFAPTMAAPPAWMERVLEGQDAPLVVLCAQETGSVPDDYDTEAATARSLPVGVVMATNVLVRRGRPFSAVVGEWGSPELEASLDRALRAAIAVATLRSKPLLQVGEPMDGYGDVVATEDELARLGVRTVPIAAEELAVAFQEVSPERLGAVVDEVRSDADTDAAAVADEVLSRSCRLSAALESLCDARQVCGGTVNCHGPMLRWNPDVGITACLGVTRLSARGMPFSCTGDIVTAIALVLGKAIAGAALYCELYQMDIGGDWMLVANGGEGDPAARAPGTPLRLLPEDHYRGQHGPGVAAAFELSEGPATLTSLTPVASAVGGWRMVVAEGQIVGSRHHRMEGPNAMFRFSGAPVADAYREWCRAGATHHAALLPGYRAEEIGCAAELLGIEWTAV